MFLKQDKNADKLTESWWINCVENNQNLKTKMYIAFMKSLTLSWTPFLIDYLEI